MPIFHSILSFRICWWVRVVDRTSSMIFASYWLGDSLYWSGSCLRARLPCRGFYLLFHKETKKWEVSNNVDSASWRTFLKIRENRLRVVRAWLSKLTCSLWVFYAYTHTLDIQSESSAQFGNCYQGNGCMLLIRDFWCSTHETKPEY